MYPWDTYLLMVTARAAAMVLTALTSLTAAGVPVVRGDDGVEGTSVSAETHPRADDAAAVTAAAPAATVAISAALILNSGQALLMGQTARVRVSWQYAVVPTVDNAVTAWPFINGSQWGAPLSLANKAGALQVSGSAEILLPIPHAGVATLVVVALRKPLLGVTVGVPLSSLTRADRLAAAAPCKIAVLHRTIHRLGSLGSGGTSPVNIGLQWEPILAAQGEGVGGGGTGWGEGAEALPLVGKYSAFDPNVLKQHAIWFAESGIDWLNIDWTNNLWGKATFAPDRGKGGGWSVINGTSYLIEGYKLLEAEGIPCPKVALMMGLMNGPNASVAALNGQIDWVMQHYPADAFITLDGLPLLLIMDGGYTHPKLPDKINATGWTLRWVAAALDVQPELVAAGYWSWMDEVNPPAVTRRNGAAESATISIGFFRFPNPHWGHSPGGWLASPSHNTSRRGGATFLQSMLTALGNRPRMIMIHQWNEFIGQGNPGGNKPPTGFFGDEYNSSMSDDGEPTSLTECAYVRTSDSVCSGWGLLFLNLQRALAALLGGSYADPGAGDDSTPNLLTIAWPTNRQPVHVGPIRITWALLGTTPGSFSVSLISQASATISAANVSAPAVCEMTGSVVSDGKGRSMAMHTCDTMLVLPASAAGRQSATILVAAFAAEVPIKALATPFALSLSEMDSGTRWIPATASVTILLGPPFPAPPSHTGTILATGPLPSP